MIIQKIIKPKNNKQMHTYVSVLGIVGILIKKKKKWYHLFLILLNSDNRN